jgi:hypothetical protein
MPASHLREWAPRVTLAVGAVAALSLALAAVAQDVATPAAAVDRADRRSRS